MGKKREKGSLGTRLRVLHFELTGQDTGRGLLSWFAKEAGGVSKSTVHRWLAAEALQAETRELIEYHIDRLAREAVGKLRARIQTVKEVA